MGACCNLRWVVLWCSIWLLVLVGSLRMDSPELTSTKEQLTTSQNHAFGTVHRWTPPHQGPSIAYRASVPELGGVLLLLLHGFCDSGAAFGPLIATLPAAWGYCAPDFRGQGDSEWGPPGCTYNYADFVGDLVVFVRFVRRKFEPSKLICVGHSFGGLIAQSASAIAGVRFDGLVALEQNGAGGCGPLIF